MDILTRYIKNIGLFFAVLFCFELVFGYSGTMLMIKGVAIRHILFLGTALCLYGYCFFYIFQNKIPWFVSNSLRKSIFKSFTFLDWAMSVLILSTVFSFLLIPVVQGGSLALAKSEILDSLLMLFLYFPIRFMITWQEFPCRFFGKYLYVLISLLAVLHIVLYVGQSLHPNFVKNYFDILSFLSGGTAQTPGIVLGHGGYPRIMYSTSLYLMVGFFFLMKRFPHWRWWDYLVAALLSVALMTTMTKSLWYGVFFGLGLQSLCVAVYYLRKKKWRRILQWFSVVLGCVLLIAVLNATIFQGIVSARLENSFVYQEDEEDYEDAESYYSQDREGAMVSNRIKLDQTKFLLEEWKEAPIFGKGYGSYVDGYLRSKVAPFSYEMFLPAMLMKIGIFGVGILVLTLVAFFVTAVKYGRKNYNSLFAWFFLLLSFILTIQTNPLLLSYNGISIFLFLGWQCVMMREEGKNQLQ